MDEAICEVVTLICKMRAKENSVMQKKTGLSARFLLQLTACAFL
jgi:hypothetical protein